MGAVRFSAFCVERRHTANASRRVRTVCVFESRVSSGHVFTLE